MTKTWNKPTSMFVAGLMLGLVAASGLFAALQSGKAGQGGAQPVRTLRLAHALAPTHPVHAGMEHLAERLEAISGGRMQVEIFPNEQLGDETECLEKVQAGTLDMTKTSCAPLGNFIQRMQAFSMPYIFRDRDHYWRVLDGEIGQSLLTGLVKRDGGQASGLRGLCFFDAGSRNFYSTKGQVRSPADLRGLKVRVMNDPIAMAMVKQMGGSATPIPWGDLYTALQQGVVDAAENNPPSFMSSSHNEVCKYFSFDEHSRIPDIVVIGTATWDKLSTQEQLWLRQAAEEASVFQRELWQQRSDEAVQAMKDSGVEIVYPDQASFREAAAPVLEQYASTPAGKLARRIMEQP